MFKSTAFNRWLSLGFRQTPTSRRCTVVYGSGGSTRSYGDHTSNRYAATLKQLSVGEGVKVMRLGSEQRALAANDTVELKDEGSEAAEAIDRDLPYVVHIDAPASQTAKAIHIAIERKVPVIVAAQEVEDQALDNEIGAVLSEQSMSRLIGPGCHIFALPHADVLFAGSGSPEIKPGRIGILAVGSTAESMINQTNKDSMGHAAIFELARAHGGTHPWELLQWMLSDSCKAEVICLLYESADADTAAVYKKYQDNAPLNEHTKSVLALGERSAWQDSGIKVFATESQLMDQLKKELTDIDGKKHATAANKSTDESDVNLTDIPPSNT